MTALDLPAIAARADAANAAVRRAEAVPRAFHNSVSVIGPVLLAVAPSAADVPALLAEVERLTALVHAKGSWIDGAKVDLDGYDDARAAIDRVRALHVYDITEVDVPCSCGVLYPCPTRRALDGGATDPQTQEG